MAPTLNEGDWLLFRSWDSRRGNFNFKALESLIGRIVLVQRSPNDFMQIKRATKMAADGKVWVEGDNASASTDSRQWGGIEPDEVRAVLLFRYRRAKL
jgi:Signal peptidase, peptidase S26